MKHRTFIAVFAATCIAISLLYVAAIRCVSPAPIGGEHWIQAAETVKRALASAETKPRILLFGGSSTLFSVSAAQISASTGRPAFNFGLHAGLPLRYHLNLAREVMRPDDLVIVIPEYGYYLGSDPNTQWLARQTLAWNYRYFDQMPIIEKFKLAAHTSPRLLLEAAVADAFSDRILSSTPDRAMLSSADAMQRFRIALKNRTMSPDQSRFAYSFENLDDHGDMLNTVGTKNFKVQTYGLTGPIPADTRGWKELAAFFSDCKQLGVECRLALAPVLRQDAKTNEAMASGLSQIVLNASQLGIPVLDERQSIFFDRPEFFDTYSHLNMSGRKARTSSLTRMLPPSFKPVLIHQPKTETSNGPS